VVTVTVADGRALAVAVPAVARMLAAIPAAASRLSCLLGFIESSCVAGRAHHRGSPDPHSYIRRGVTGEIQFRRGNRLTK
jgi:hypothetical protein